jgi:beta-carotene hydroxylase
MRKLWRKFELLEWFLSRLSMVSVVWFASSHGHLGYVMNYWFTPALVVGLALGLFFDYLPHRNFQERDRWKNARVYPSALLNVLILGQNYHLIHHLWPSVPWYKVQPAYYAVKPLLDTKGSPQTLDIFNRKNIGSFLYDALIGIRFHRHSDAVPEIADRGLLFEEKHQLEELLREQTAEVRESASLQMTDRAA